MSDQAWADLYANTLKELHDANSRAVKLQNDLTIAETKVAEQRKVIQEQFLDNMVFDTGWQALVEENDLLKAKVEQYEGSLNIDGDEYDVADLRAHIILRENEIANLEEYIKHLRSTK